MPQRIERDEVRRLVDEERAQLVEVLPRDEYDYEHIAGAINIPLREIDREPLGSSTATAPSSSTATITSET